MTSNPPMSGRTAPGIVVKNRMIFCAIIFLLLKFF
jgi:hypothetical protein